MGTDRACRAVVGSLALWLGLVAAVSAQPNDPPRGASLLLIDEDTRVGSVDFRFVTGPSLAESPLRNQLALSGPRGLASIRNALAWLPFVSPAPLSPFSPVELQKDQIRLTRQYHREGFPRASVRYEVTLDSTANKVAIVFVIDEGPPQLLRELAFARPGGEELELEPELRDPWSRFVGQSRAVVGDRLSETLKTRLRSESLEWLRDHGYAFAEITTTVRPDSAASVADLVLEIDPGPRSRVGAVSVEGNRAISERTIRRELPFRSGDRFRSSRLSEGQRQLFGLDLVRVALVDIAMDQPRDSTADVRVRLEEGSLRTIEGQLGYTSEAGLSASAAWSHRDFLGGARTMRASVESRSGILGTAEGPQRQYGASVSLRQPYIGHWRVSGLFTPFVEYRDDLRDQSTRVGVDATVLWERGALRNLSLDLRFAARRVSQTRGGALTGAGNLIELLRALDTLEIGGRTAILGLSGTWGLLDNQLNPRAGWVARAGAELAGPAPLSTVNYGRVSGTLHGFVRLGAGAGLAARLSAGRLFPFGRSIPAAGSELAGLLRLRDAIFTAGGTEDVRGWGAGLLGPKVPDFDFEVRGDSVILSSADRYVPLGGLARWTGSIELRGPSPFAGASNHVFGFLDGGRVWIPDARFVVGGTNDSSEERAFYGTGVGIQFGTPAGPLRISLGYKLNPSLLDLRDPKLVAQALLLDQPITVVPAEPSRRWKLHLSIGTSF